MPKVIGKWPGVAGTTLVHGLLGLSALSGATHAGVQHAYALAPNETLATADQACRSSTYAYEAQATPLNWPRQSPPQALDAACWVSAAQALNARADGSGHAATLVDIRPKAARQATPIANALQMELSDVANKRFLRDQPFLLVGTGLDYVAITKACQQLREQGFTQARALRGGYAEWQQATATSGAPGLLVQSIQASEWIAALGQGVRWTVLSLSTNLQSAQQGQIPVPSSQIVNLSGKAAGVPAVRDFASTLSRLSDAYRRLAYLHRESVLPEAVMVMTEQGLPDSQRMQLEQAFNDAEVPGRNIPVYLLQGGWQGYVRQVAQTAAIQQTANQKLQAPCGRI